jgi:hypothetical protein
MQERETPRVDRALDFQTVLVELGETITRSTSTTSRSQLQSMRRTRRRRDLRNNYVAQNEDSASTLPSTQPSTSTTATLSQPSIESSATSNDGSSSCHRTPKNSSSTHKIRLCNSKQGQSVQAIRGLLNGTWKTILLDRHLEVNVVSQNDAVALGLEFNPFLSSEGEAELDFGGGYVEQPVGSGTCTWFKVTRPGIPLFTFDYLICKNLDWPITFGQPFIREYERFS